MIRQNDVPVEVENDMAKFVADSDRHKLKLGLFVWRYYLGLKIRPNTIQSIIQFEPILYGNRMSQFETNHIQVQNNP